MRRSCAGFVVVVLVALCSALPASAVDDTPGENLGGYDSLASAVAFSFRPFLPALISTGDVPFEGSFALSTSRVKSGGNAFGRGALVYPGSGAANLGPIVGVAFGQPELGALIPPWPFQAEATQTDGEVVTGQPPAIAMTAKGFPDSATADVRFADIHIPRVIHVEHVASTGSSVVLDDSVTSTGRVIMHGVSLLAGFIKAEQIRSIARTTSLGSATSTSGDVDIVGLTIGGAEVSITDEGFQVDGLPPDAQQLPGAGGEPVPNQSPEEYVNAVLESLGARITLFKGISVQRGGQAERMEPGVVISVDNPVGGTGPIPPGRFDIFIASTSASALGTLPFGANLPDVSTPQDGGGGGPDTSPPSISIGDGPKVGGETLTEVGEEATDAAQGSLGAVGELDEAIAQSGDYRFDGLPWAMVIFLLLLAALAARYIRNFFNSLMCGAADGREEEPQ